MSAPTSGTQRTSPVSLSPDDTSLSITHPPPSADSSTTDVLQRSFDTFNALISSDHRDLTIGLDGLKRALQLFAQSNDASSVPIVHVDEARAIMDIAAGAHSERLTFSQFHNVYAALNILQKLSAQELPHLRMKDVRRALISAGINPTQAQLDQMMVLGDAYKTFDKRGQIEFKEFLRIYTSSRTNPSHVFLHSWFHAGRNSTAMRKPVEMSPFQDFLAGTAAGVSLTLVGVSSDSSRTEHCAAWDVGERFSRHSAISPCTALVRVLSIRSTPSRCVCRRRRGSRADWTVCCRRCATRAC